MSSSSFSPPYPALSLVLLSSFSFYPFFCILFVSLSRFSFLSSLSPHNISTTFFLLFPLVVSLFSPLLHYLSLAFIIQGKPCGSNGRLVIWRQRDSSQKMCP
ncbi:hypothetical protein NC652_033929 [Populus alba x Populus x berolinensis]|nr:hypothetical protein NC652_033929 [Populus alba x Populus x berolinensis]